MQPEFELAYVGIEVPDPATLTPFFGEIIGLVPGEATDDGALTWRNDDKAHRVIVRPGPANDAVFLGFEAVDDDAFDAMAARLASTGPDVTEGSDGDLRARRVKRLVRASTPWGVPVEVVLALEEASTPFASPHIPGGFFTEGVGFGHAVFATTAFDESHALPGRRPRPRAVGLARDGDRGGHRARSALLSLQRAAPQHRARKGTVRHAADAASHHVRDERARRRRRRIRPGVGDGSRDPRTGSAATTTTACSASMS